MSEPEKLGVVLTYVDLLHRYARLQLYDKELAVARQWQGADPSNPVPHVYAANAFGGLRLIKEGEEEVAKAVALDPNCLQAFAARYGLLTLNDRKIEAAAIADKALSIQSRDEIDEEVMTRFLRYLRRFDTARDRVKKMLATEPNAPHSLYAACLVELAAGGRDSAVAACNTYVQKIPDSIAAGSVSRPPTRQCASTTKPLTR